MIDAKVKKSREDFHNGFVKGVKFSFWVYTLHSLFTSAAHATDFNVPAPPPSDPGPVQPAPNPKPGRRPLRGTTKRTFSGGASAVCLAALKSGDFARGLACAFL